MPSHLRFSHGPIGRLYNHLATSSMNKLTVSPYGPEWAASWNSFVAGSRNGTFLHDRRFMDYHSDRFIDASLLVERAGKVIALLPANRDGDRGYPDRKSSSAESLSLI